MTDDMMAQLRVQHERWLRFDSGAGPGQVADSSTIVQLLDIIHGIKRDADICRHPGCCCVCGHQRKCPEDGPTATGGFGTKWAD